jgi:Malectin domain
MTVLVSFAWIILTMIMMMQRRIVASPYKLRTTTTNQRRTSLSSQTQQPQQQEQQLGEQQQEPQQRQLKESRESSFSSSSSSTSSSQQQQRQRTLSTTITMYTTTTATPLTTNTTTTSMTPTSLGSHRDGTIQKDGTLNLIKILNLRRRTRTPAVRIDCGNMGKDYMDPKDNSTYLTDRYYNDNSNFKIVDPSLCPSGSLYCSYRFGDHIWYNVHVKTIGAYKVTILLMEPFWEESNRRHFNIIFPNDPKSNRYHIDIYNTTRQKYAPMNISIWNVQVNETSHTRHEPTGTITHRLPIHFESVDIKGGVQKAVVSGIIVEA